MQKQLLAICIPTYNRAAKIRDMLEHTAETANKYGIDIYISDNHSNDDTEKVVKSFAEQYDNIHYHKHSANLGWLKNFDFVVHEPDTAYRWLMGDDDLIRLENIPEILSILERKNPQLLVVNGGAMDKTGRIKGNAYEGDGYIEYTDRNKLLGDIGYYTSWMSGLVFSASMIENISLLDYSWTAFSHMAAIFDYLGKQETIKVGYFAKPSVYNNSFQSGGADYTDKALGYFTKDWYHISVFLKQYSIESINRFRIGHRDHVNAFTVKMFESLRIKGYYNLQKYHEYKDYLFCCTKLPLWVLKAIAMAPPILPKPVFYFLKRVKNRVR